MTAREALERLPVPEPPGSDQRLLERVLARLAQLEKVAELARLIPPAVSMPTERGADAVLLLELALTELDYPGDTPGPYAAEVGDEAAARAAWPTWSHDRTSIKED